MIVFPPGCKHRSPDGAVVKLALKGTPLTVSALISRRVPNGLSAIRKLSKGTAESGNITSGFPVTRT